MTKVHFRVSNRNEPHFDRVNVSMLLKSVKINLLLFREGSIHLKVDRRITKSKTVKMHPIGFFSFRLKIYLDAVVVLQIEYILQNLKQIYHYFINK